MTATIPPSHLDLIAGPVYAVLTTIAADGQPENTVVWCSCCLLYTSRCV